jgi:capsular polysaccharide export protein
MTQNSLYPCCWISSSEKKQDSHLKVWLEVEKCKKINIARPWPNPGPEDIIAGWDINPNTSAARKFASSYSLKYVTLTEGFIYSQRNLTVNNQRLSLIGDSFGVYYDATAPSSLENLLNNGDLANPELLHRAEKAIQIILHYRLSEPNLYNSVDLPKLLWSTLRNDPRRKVLIVDQTFDEKSVQFGLSDKDTFRSMLHSALKENPHAAIFIKVHPDFIKGTKKGYLTDMLEGGIADKVQIITIDCNHLNLLRHFDHVYVVTSQMGFEALLLNKKVTCFGMPFYAGWGVTEDRQHCQRRSHKRTVIEIFAAAYLLYCRYMDPDTLQRCELETVLDHLKDNRNSSPSPHVDQLWCVNFPLWKRSFVRKFVNNQANTLLFCKNLPTAKSLSPEDGVLVWGRKLDEKLSHLPYEIAVWRMEDGFLRSVGLGSDLHRPASLVLDDLGIYYDPNVPSRLEHILSQKTYNSADVFRTEKLITRLVQCRLSKYNVGQTKKINWREKSKNRSIILVPGQVEDDASIQLGTRDISNNSELLKAVRIQSPDAFIIYKPHPDVTSGNRKGDVPQNVLDSCCDDVVVDVDIIDCLLAVDEVHTMTSLCGFEALLHGKTVHCYGLPFYAGWGLTHDRHQHPRRSRTLSLTELVAGTLIHYPLYYNWRTSRLTTPEGVIHQLELEKKSSFQEENTLFTKTINRYKRKIGFLIEALSR